MARLYVGTSGWAYAAWKGKFYPPKIRADEMLPFYAGHFGAVEINNSFYRMPAADDVARWRELAPPGFRFAMKAPAQITQRRDLASAQPAIERFVELSAVLGDKQGPLLFQLAPKIKPEIERLASLLAIVKPFGRQLAAELRHPDWLCQPVFDLLREHDVALCQTETDDGTAPSLPASGFAYLRLRKTEYTPAELEGWRARLADMRANGRDVYVFLKHEDSAKGPAYASKLLAAA